MVGRAVEDKIARRQVGFDVCKIVEESPIAAASELAGASIALPEPPPHAWRGRDGP
jgi:hypothetical protein